MEDYCVVCGRIVPDGRQVCPICNREYIGMPALSRSDNRTLICPDCGTVQALDAALSVSDMTDDAKKEYKQNIMRAIHKYGQTEGK